jgi:hypothetical protein
MISKTEGYAILLFAVFGVVLVAFINPFLQNSSWFYTLSPLIAYPVYNIGWYLVFTVLLGLPLSMVVSVVHKRKPKVHLWDILKGGIAAFASYSWVYDMLQGPFYLNSNGAVLIPLGTSSLENTAVDAFWAEIFKFFGISGFPLYLFTYFIVVMVGIVIIAWMSGTFEFLRIVMRKK